nr:DUF262 domain-containing protein [uncultured Sphingobacterium sp.]
MAKLKTMYPLRGIFTNLLEDSSKKGFLIPTYQRGYKWVASEGNGQVDILMRDLFNAYSHKSLRYFLQFLTLKQCGEELEVIDGQQRLTTLSILFKVIEDIIGEDPKGNFVIGKLKYQTRQNFIERFIYGDIGAITDCSSWDEFQKGNQEHNNQDVYFIFHAVKAIDDFLKDKMSLVRPFYEYICSNVYLIVNLLDENLNSEKVFVNVNKGVKLNDEDLVKGLLITKLPFDLLSHKVRATEIEINELRANLGRQWDDLSNWAFREDIKLFFKSDNTNSRIDWLIRLTYPDIPQDDSGHPIFTYFDNLYTEGGISAEEIFNSIRRTKMLLNDWFNEPETRNLLGFVINCYGSPKKEALWTQLKNMGSKAELIRHLKAKCLALLPLDGEQNLPDLSYDTHREPLFNLFLMLDVMKFLPINGREAKQYDFKKISTGIWSLEHIFPQTMQDLKMLNELSDDDLSMVKQLLGGDIERLAMDESVEAKEMYALYKKIMKATGAFKITKEERITLSNLLKFNAPDLHGIGNMALLLKNMNSSLSNHFFRTKREMIVKKISTGEFVPYHTYDVFSKLIILDGSDLNVWTSANILEHANYINNQVREVVNYLNPQS